MAAADLWVAGRGTTEANSSWLWTGWKWSRRSRPDLGVGWSDLLNVAARWRRTPGRMDLDVAMAAYEEDIVWGLDEACRCGGSVGEEGWRR